MKLVELRKRVAELEAEVERLRASQESLPFSDKNLKALLNANQESTFMIDLEGIVHTANEKTAERLNCQLQDLIGKSIYDFIPPDVAELRRQWVAEVVRTGEPQHYEDVRADRFVKHDLYPVFNAQEEVTSVAICGTDITEYKNIEDSLRKQNKLISSIRRAQNLYISGREPREAFKELLDLLVATTGSEYGFIDEVLQDADGKPYKLSVALSDISWSEDSRWLYQDLVARKLEFRNMDNLAGLPVIQKEVVISNDRTSDSRSGGLPPGHPSLNTYMGVPLFFGDQLIGVLGVANRPGGYSMRDARLLEPLASSCAGMIWAQRMLRKDLESTARLQESEARYRRIVETANEGIWAMDSQFRTTFVNSRMADMLGYTMEQMIGRRVDSFMFEEDLIDHAEKMDGRAHGASAVYERRFRCKDGSTLWTIVSATALKDKEGCFAGSFAMFSDITDRKHLHEMLRESEQFHRAILSSISDSVFLTDGRGVFKFVCPNVDHTFGYTQAEVEEMGNIDRLLGADLFERNDLRKQGELVNIEKRVEDKFGGRRDLLINVKLVDIQQESVLYCCRDVSDRKLAEEALRRSESRFRTLTEHCPVGIYLADSQGRCEYANPRWLEMAGLSLEEALGDGWTDGLHPYDLQRVEAAWHQTVAANGKWGHEYRFESREGKTTWVYGHATALRNSTGEIIGYIGTNTDITDRKRYEETLKAAVRLNSIMSGHTSDELAQLGLEEALRLTDSLVGFFHLVSPDETSIVFQAWSKEVHEGCAVLGKGSHYPIEQAGVWADALRERRPIIHNDYAALSSKRGLPPGHVSIMREVAVPVFKDNRIIALLCVANRDSDYSAFDVDQLSLIAETTCHIMQRKRAEEELALREKEFRLVFEHNKDAIFWADVETGVIINCNRQAEILSGRSRTELIGMHQTKLHSPDKADLYARLFKQSVKQPPDASIEIELCSKDGKITQILASTSVVALDNRKIIQGVFVDISERKRMREILDEREELFSKVFHQSPALVGISRKSDGSNIEVNDEFVKATGFSYDKIISRSALELDLWANPTDRQRLLDLLETTELVRGFETSIRRRSGEVFPVLISAMPLLIKGEQCLLVSAMDISESKRAVEETLRLESQLRQAQKMEAIGTLAGGIAHDFNNILAAIIGYTEMALEAFKGEVRAKHDMRQVLKAAYRAKDLVSQILAFSRRREKDEYHPVNIYPILREALKLLRASLPTTIEIVQKFEPASSMVLADPSQIHQVVMNLCANAAHAMHEKDGVLKILVKEVQVDREYFSYLPDLAPGNYIKMSVVDNGRGMSPEIMQRIFEPYFTTKSDRGGSGLGLAVVHGIIERHKGSIQVHSELGKGSEFHIFLPAVDANQVAKITKNFFVTGGKECILFVDDEESLTKVTKRVLSSLGYEVHASNCPQKALDLFKSRPNRFDLVITDYTMPHMTGLELAHSLLEIREDLPIILCTGYNDLVSEQRALELGFKAFARKPLSKSEIAGLVRNVLDRVSH